MNQLVEIALRRPVTSVVVAILVLILGVGALATSFAGGHPAARSDAFAGGVLVAADTNAPAFHPAVDENELEDDLVEASAPAGGVPGVFTGHVSSVLRRLADAPRSTTPQDAVSDAWFPPARVQRIQGARAPPLGSLVPSPC